MACESFAGSRAIACSVYVCMSMDPTDVKFGVSVVSALCNTFSLRFGILNVGNTSC